MIALNTHLHLKMDTWDKVKKILDKICDKYSLELGLFSLTLRTKSVTGLYHNSKRMR